MLQFLGGHDALDGIGTTARPLRAAAQAALPCLALRHCHYLPVVPALNGYTALRHLKLHRVPIGEALEWAVGIVAAGLPARLESFRLDAFWHGADWHDNPAEYPRAPVKTLVSVEWPRLRVIEVEWFQDLLDALAARPRGVVVFPRLLSIAAARTRDVQPRMLLSLLEQGAFPSLTGLAAPLLNQVSEHGARLVPYDESHMTTISPGAARGC